MSRPETIVVVHNALAAPLQIARVCVVPLIAISCAGMLAPPLAEARSPRCELQADPLVRATPPGESAPFGVRMRAKSTCTGKRAKTLYFALVIEFASGVTKVEPQGGSAFVDKARIDDWSNCDNYDHLVTPEDQPTSWRLRAVVRKGVGRRTGRVLRRKLSAPTDFAEVCPEAFSSGDA